MKGNIKAQIQVLYCHEIGMFILKYFIHYSCNCPSRYVSKSRSKWIVITG